MRVRLTALCLVTLTYVLSIPHGFAQAQPAPRLITPYNLALAHAILRDAYHEVEKNYYDPTFHGIDLAGRYHTYDAYLDRAPTIGQAFGVIAAFLGGFNDSHLFFEPPERGVRYDPGYQMRIIGRRCFVTSVRPHSDAASKLRAGDELLSLDGYAVNRADFTDVQYYLHVLTPLSSEQLEVRGSDGAAPRKVIIQEERTFPRRTTIDLTSEQSSDYWELIRRGENDEHQNRDRVVELGDIAIWKMARFGDDENALGAVLSKIKHYPNLILDLRGNPGGYTDSLRWIVGEMFDHDVKIADRVTRKPDKPMLAKAPRQPYRGRIVVLVDAASASSSELFARVMQLEHRGTVLGDTTAGAVMEARDFTDKQVSDTNVFYGFSVTRANLLMTDGKSLEGVGVTPDEIVLATAKDIAGDRDPVLARAIQLSGGAMDAEAAGRLFPYEWPKL